MQLRPRRAKPATEPFDSASIAPPTYLESLRRYLERLGHTYSKPYLMGVSGEAFKFFYDRARPANSVWVFLNNPLRSAANALGFKHEIAFSETREEALEALEKTLRKDERSAIIPCGETFPLIHPDGSVENGGESATYDSVVAEWSSDEGFLELGLFGYYYFTLGERDREPKPREVFLGAFRRAMKIAKAYRRVRGCAIGLQAYDELAAILGAKRDFDRVPPSEPARIASWNVAASRALLDSRRAAVLFLRESLEAFAEQEEKTAVNKATRLYERVAAALARLVETHPALDDGFTERLGVSAEGDFDKSALRRFYRECRRAALYVERARAYEDRGCDELQNIINISEKTKM